MADEQTSGAGLDEFFSKKYGPLPGWGWAAVAAGGAGLYIWYRNKHAAATSAASTSVPTTASGGAQGYDYGPSYAATQSEIQALQNGYGQLSQQVSSSTPSTSTTPTTSTAPSTSSAPTTTMANPGPSGPIPNVVGLTAAQARSTLANAGFRVGGGNANAPSGQKIVSQTPGKGQTISYGSAYWPIGQGAPVVDIG